MPSKTQIQLNLGVHLMISECHSYFSIISLPNGFIYTGFFHLGSKESREERFLSFQYIQWIKNLKIPLSYKRFFPFNFLTSVLKTLVRKTHII